MDIFYGRNMNRAKKISSFYGDYLKKGQKVIDIGAGNCLNAKQMKLDYNIDITCIDIIDFNQSDIKFILFDGKKVPFKNNSYDMALITATLHHCDEPLRILEEAKRVAKRILVLEDVYVSKFHLLIMKLYDFIMNFRHGMNIPFNFKKNKEWLDTFKNLGFTVLATKRFNYNPFYSPMITMLYILDKEK